MDKQTNNDACLFGHYLIISVQISYQHLLEAEDYVLWIYE